MDEARAVTVLIADDSSLFVDALAAVLSGEPEIAVVASARDGEEALRLTREVAPDVVLMDISMPVMDGFDATRRIKQEHPQTAVLMLTGSAAPADMRRAEAAGASAYVTKDRMAVDLVATIRRAVGRDRSLS
jgi:DNA-binding NarL/FixJ family response regulator